MKKIYFAIIALALNPGVMAQTKSVTLDEAGTLSSYITDDDITTLKDLTITGPINGDDIRLLRQLAHSNETFNATDEDFVGSLESLDLTDARIVRGGSHYALHPWDGNQTPLVTEDDVIGDFMFGGCQTLTSFRMPLGTIRIGDNAFNSVPLEDLTFSPALESIGVQAFGFCKLESLDLPASLTTLSDYAFAYNMSLKHLTLGDNISDIGQSVFMMCSALEDVHIGKSLPVCTFAWIFTGCTGITGYDVDADNPNYISTGGAVYSKDMTTLYAWPSAYVGDLTIPEGVRIIDEGCFGTCKFIEGVTFPSTAREIRMQAFSTSTVSNLNLNEGLEVIGAQAFSMTAGLRGTVKLPSTVKTIGRQAFFMCTVPDLVLNEGLDSLGEQALASSYIEQCVLPSTLRVIGRQALSGCYYLNDIEVAEGSPYYTSVDGVLFSADMSRLVFYPIGVTRPVTEYQIPDGVTEIGLNAFQGAGALKTVVFPETVTKIDEMAFNMCAGLETVKLPESLRQIDGMAFTSCSTLTEIEIGSQVDSIGNYALAWNQEVRKVTCKAATPPALGDMVFGGYDMEACVLNVPEDCVDAYLAAEQWRDFNITGISGITESIASDEMGQSGHGKVVARYSTDGSVANANQLRGIVIERLADGTTRKIMAR